MTKKTPLILVGLLCCGAPFTSCQDGMIGESSTPNAAIELLKVKFNDELKVKYSAGLSRMKIKIANSENEYFLLVESDDLCEITIYRVNLLAKSASHLRTFSAESRIGDVFFDCQSGYLWVFYYDAKKMRTIGGRVRTQDDDLKELSLPAKVTIEAVVMLPDLETVIIGLWKSGTKSSLLERRAVVLDKHGKWRWLDSPVVLVADILPSNRMSVISTGNLVYVAWFGAKVLNDKTIDFSQGALNVRVLKVDDNTPKLSATQTVGFATLPPWGPPHDPIILKSTGHGIRLKYQHTATGNYVLDRDQTPIIDMILSEPKNFEEVKK